jgi:hypothetical protein
MTRTLASDVFTFSNFSSRRDVAAVFAAHVTRFEHQNRDVSWKEAPAVFAAVIGDDDDKETIRQFRGALEDLLDSGAIIVDRLPDGSNRLRTA